MSIRFTLKAMHRCIAPIGRVCWKQRTPGGTVAFVTHTDAQKIGALCELIMEDAEKRLPAS